MFFASFKGGGKFEEEANRNAIKRALVWMLANPDCEKAFIDAKLATPASVIKKRGLTLASGDLMPPCGSCSHNMPLPNGLSEFRRRRLRRARSVWVQLCEQPH